MGGRRAVGAAVVALVFVSGSSARTPERLDAVLLADADRGHWLVWCEAGTDDAADVRLTRLDATGAPRQEWSERGIVVCTAPDAQREPALAHDARGGVWIAWSDRRSGPRRVHVARHAADGRVVVAERRIGASGREDFRPALRAAGEGGVLVAWESWDGRSSDVRVQRLDAAGGVAAGWPAEGLGVADSPFEECAPQWVERDGIAALAWTAYDGSDPRRGVLRAATLAPREPRVLWRGLGVEPASSR